MPVSPAGSPDALTPDALEQLAHEYYLSGDVADLDIEELAQRRSIRQLVAALGDAAPTARPRGCWRWASGRA